MKKKGRMKKGRREGRKGRKRKEKEEKRKGREKEGGKEKAKGKREEGKKRKKVKSDNLDLPYLLGSYLLQTSLEPSNPRILRPPFFIFIFFFWFLGGPWGRGIGIGIVKIWERGEGDEEFPR